MKSKLKSYLGDKNPKSYVRMLGSNPILLDYVTNFKTDHGLENMSEAVFCILNDQLPNKCGCGSKAAFNTFVKGYHYYCSSKCEVRRKDHAAKIAAVWQDKDKLSAMIEKKNTTIMERYGVDNPVHIDGVKEKMKTTSLEKYGTAFPISSDIVSAKFKNTNLEKYGVEFPFQSTEIRKQAADTYYKNHGTECKMEIPRAVYAEMNENKNPFQVLEVQDKIKGILIEKYGVDHPMKSPAILQKSINTLFSHYGKTNSAQIHINQEIYDILIDKDSLEKLLKESTPSSICKKYGISRSLLIQHHNNHGLELIKQRARSGYEEEISAILDKLGIQYRRNYNKLCYPKQVDFYIEKHKLAIEFNGLYWHSEVSGLKSHDYHAEKMRQCKSQGIQLLTIFEDEWIDRSEVIINHIKHLCKMTDNVIGARKLDVSEEKYTDEIKMFLDKHHVQGKTEAVSKLLVARLDNEIRAVFMLRKVKVGEYDIIRYCTDTRASYAGLFSKFLSYARDFSEIKTLTTIADLRWSYGDVYLKTGFTQVGEIAPDYAYTDFRTREHKFNYRKDKIKSRFNVDIDGKTEKELMKSLGFDRVWDCGKIKFELKF
jgi:very-short-patch-repair endonuclease